MHTQPLEYRHEDTVMLGELVYDDARSDRRPGVLVFHEGSGLADHPRRRARQLAEMGYVALACDMYGGRKVAANMDESRALLGALRADPPRLRARARAGLEALRAVAQVDVTRLGAIGFCFGGLTVLELARDGAALSGVVSFHGILRTAQPALAGQVKAKVLACHGFRDPFVPPADLTTFMEEMEQAGVDWQVLTHGAAGHGFTNPAADRLGVAGVAYNENAERRSWAAMRDFFDGLFATP
jgi:dienelactone hydrolase